MLALLAVLVLSPSRILPEPFLTNRLEPILPLEPLKGVARTSVTRGSHWRPGGYVRLNYFYAFPQGKGPTHRSFMDLGGFTEENGFNGVLRAVRHVNGIRQVVAVTDLEAGSEWKWAKVEGPARLVSVSEFPMEDVPRWHHLPQLERPPLPPQYPPNYSFIKGTSLGAIYCDPLIPRGFRNSYGMQVRLFSSRPTEEIWDQAEAVLLDPDWKVDRSKVYRSFIRKARQYGLVRIEVYRTSIPNSRHKSEILLHYLFEDLENGPRIKD